MAPLLNAREAAQRLRLSPDLLRQLVRDGSGPRVTRLGTGRGRLFFSEAALAEWLESCTEQRATDRSRAA